MLFKIYIIIIKNYKINKKLFIKIKIIFKTDLLIHRLLCVNLYLMKKIFKIKHN